ncbi:MULTISPECIES: HAD-IA family hydrolase [unclassified Oleiphilus]|jgi:phosphoglycolate phosphatase|uniref:HAD-IA family hydrolase n=3 Tax=Oleiphilus TaxID=141450 RepID=UPI0007C2F8D1|nr:MULTISPECIES: HAD-IA family hydrolase [unclassified Oleiphilus]KZY41515.1 HAD family hydrolase [Oleiphilus sp. HI0050]KZY77732.1 HAD family hydrolase [Oleiphilus sp. HI0068]KZY80221.1 HAD family hydrolase [Oleiphilus sp. HI0069]KZY91582.1 HAD family hydrolase [Oleiphilus sp. HI0072]KZZ19355.1 HAD family hydrolase [Oleiphilus sp. HI0078]KZZ28609.1 HAD family hydrolase [Oleiphilus sp. HI0081]KZZ33090.1 HAD family hydrolase [Oleiphilus sp. HI0085]
MKYPVYIFDWDGTLVDSEQHIVASLEYAANKLSLPDLGHDAYKNIIGLGMVEALQSLYPSLSDKDVENMRQSYAEFFFRREMTQENLFDGVIETLEALKAGGLSLAVATGKSRNGLNLALKATGLGHYFDIERCADETRSKPHPMMLEEICSYYGVPAKECVMVGDTEYDLKMASNFGMDAIGVSYGVHEVSRLSVHEPKAIIDHFSELIKLNVS